MSLFVLAETAAGYGLFKATDKKMLKNEDLAADFGKPEKLVEMLKLKKFIKFDSAAMALEEAASLRDGKVPTLLNNLLQEHLGEKKASIAVADTKLGTSISNLPSLNITPMAGNQTIDLFRGIREHLPSLIPGLEKQTLDRMALGLSHSMSRHQLKFSADKVDAMVIQAIKLIDDIDKEINLYAMRTKEWYGWHFPEMAKILNDNMAYARVIKATGKRTAMADTDLSDILSSEMEEAIKAAADISMGTDITDEDLDNVMLMADQVINGIEYRAEITSYLESRMRAIAPNLTALVGYLVGARLIAHTGSLISLAKSAGSTIQILGAEKALFRALKTKHDTPKYGLIYHTSLIGQATGRNKGKLARKLSAKVALGLRIDALGDDDDEKDDEERAIHGLSSRIKLENDLRKMEGKPLLPKGTNITPSGDVVGSGAFTLKETRVYNKDADGVDETNGEVKEKSKKDKKRAKIEAIQEEAEQDEEMEDVDEEEEDDSATPAKSTVAKLSSAEYERLAELAGISAKKFKRKYERGDVQVENGVPTVVSKKELKKLRKAEAKSTPSKSAPIAAEPVSEGKKKRKHDEETSTPSKAAAASNGTVEKKKKRKLVEEEDEPSSAKKEKKQKKKRDSLPA
ncbi:hypothetical protein S40285_04843 [Stachybotrys chlorohalonatus IBT 40285]|uniref:Nucleolar protein 58 n=1 Tax=Stachybotrys chlorohalonatus (strain IBT 40285) TaxID=1283841 RepID=A0A084QA90_STAC4|nr:hypothetical protein S40285_04843 [Stachybotrys chlorohalonata IBT 40285]